MNSGALSLSMSGENHLGSRGRIRLSGRPGSLGHPGMQEKPTRYGSFSNNIQIDDILIQEGIPTRQSINGYATEEVVYNVNGQVVGGFYRMHPTRNHTDILNANGMLFKRFCQSKTKLCCENESIFGDFTEFSHASIILSRLANLAAQQECHHL